MADKPMPTPEEIRSQLDDLLKYQEECRAAAKRTSEARKAVVAAMGALEAAKAKLKQAETTLNELQWEEHRTVVGNPQPMLPYKRDDDQNSPTASWRSMPIDGEEVGLPADVSRLLMEAKLKTLGAFADWVRQGNDVTDIKGMGEGRAEKLMKALDEFWAKQQFKNDDEKKGGPSDPEKK